MAKKFLRGSNERFVFQDHDDSLDRFMWKFVDMDSHKDFIEIVCEHIAEFKIILQDYMLPNYKKIQYVLSSLNNGYKLLLIAGARGSGKTCTGFWLIEEIHKLNSRRRIAYVGVKLNPRLLPSWCENYTIEEYDEKMNKNTLNGYFVIIDEAAMFFNARKYQDKANIKFGQMIAISRHKHISLIVIAQDHNMTDTNIWRLRDCVLYKKSNTYELSDRDTKGKAGNSKIHKFWNYIKQWMHPKRKSESLFEYQAERRLMLFDNPIPQCWTTELSEAFDNFNVDNIRVEVKPIIKTKQKSIEVDVY